MKREDYVLLDLKKIKDKSNLMKSLIIPELDEDDYVVSSEDYWKNVLEYAQIYLIFDRGYANYRVRLSSGNTYDMDKEDIIRLLTQDEIGIYNSKN